MIWKSHGGNLAALSRKSGLNPEDILDFSANINPLGFPECIRPVVSRFLSKITCYPDPDCTALKVAFSNHWKIPVEEVLFGNGSEELLYALPRAFGRGRALIPVPAYVDYRTACLSSGLIVERFSLKEEEGFVVDLDRLEGVLSGDEIVFLGQPANPTGLTIDTEKLRQLAHRKPETLFVIDEAFADFVEDLERLIMFRPPNVVVSGSFTKFYAIPGLRLGFVVAAAKSIEKIRNIMPPWSVSTLAQAAGVAVLSDKDYSKKSRVLIKSERERLSTALNSIPGLYVYPGKANYLLVRIDRSDGNACVLARRLLAEGIAIRLCDNFDGLDDRFFRIAVRTEEENGRFIGSLRATLAPGRTPLVHPLIKDDNGRGIQVRIDSKKRPAIMFQGTGSNAGKSVLVTAFCRILLQDGYVVAPFKAQNMSLNSYVTKDGGEMGRAQVVQAQACRLDPDVRMNPILLKPNSDTGSQVIVLGKPVANMDVAAYVRYKPEVFEKAKSAYEALCAESEVMVLEGAGSPAEVNLKRHDIVNMLMARYAASPVILVGDIDRGGVFASFVGTMEVLAEWERRLVAGFVVNRFRGEKALLADAFAYTDMHTGLPTFGVVPYIANLGLPEEDSVTFKGLPASGDSRDEDSVQIAVIDLPHISNFTDFDSLGLEPDVHVRIVRAAHDLGHPDAVILPGSKNTISDMDYLFSNGFTEKIIDLAQSGKTEIIGICGGFQMLGQTITDPHGIESSAKTMAGLGLMGVTTTLMPEKALKATGARHSESGSKLRGYEIHHGQTEGNGLTPLVVRDDGETIGFKSLDGLIWGTYLHGVFDADEFRRFFVDRLRVRRNLAPIGKVIAVYDLEPALDRLATHVRESLDINAMYRRIGLK